MKTVIRVNQVIWDDGIPYNKGETYYTNLKKSVIESGLNYNTLKKFKLPFEYKNFLFEKVEILWKSEE